MKEINLTLIKELPLNKDKSYIIAPLLKHIIVDSVIILKMLDLSKENVKK